MKIIAAICFAIILAMMIPIAAWYLNPFHRLQFEIWTHPFSYANGFSSIIHLPPTATPKEIIDIYAKGTRGTDYPPGPYHILKVKDPREGSEALCETNHGLVIATFYYDRTNGCWNCRDYRVKWPYLTELALKD